MKFSSIAALVFSLVTYTLAQGLTGTCEGHDCWIHGEIARKACEDVRTRPTPILILKRVVDIEIRDSHARKPATNVIGFRGIELPSVIKLIKLQEGRVSDEGIGMGFR